MLFRSYLDQANARFSLFSATDAEEARRLYIAHKLTMYARTALPAGVTPSMSSIAVAGKQLSQIASKKVDDVEVRYATGSSASVRNDTGFADLDQTPYGLQLLALLRLYHATKYIR